jgi:hypothetical protein
MTDNMISHFNFIYPDDPVVVEYLYSYAIPPDRGMRAGGFKVC